MNRFLIFLLLIVALVLTACSASSPSIQTPPTPVAVSNTIATPTDDPALIPTLFPDMNNNADMMRTDQQGMIIVEVTPLNLGTPADSLEFEVAMNTHSIDLSMDLATLATLSTDTGATVQATTWDAPRGGHHVSGKLIFPSIKDGKSILEGAGKLTLTITNLDAPSRIFEWELQ